MQTVICDLLGIHPVRCLENRMARQFQAMEKGDASLDELERFGQGKFELGVLEGDIDNGSLMVGQICGLVSEIKPAAAIIKEIVEQAESIIAKLNSSYVGAIRG